MKLNFVSSIFSLTKTKKRLSKLGINYDFFTPVDVPEGLVNKIVKEEKEDIEEKPSKVKGKKGKVQEFEVENVKPKVNKSSFSKNLAIPTVQYCFQYQSLAFASFEVNIITSIFIH